MKASSFINFKKSFALSAVDGGDEGLQRRAGVAGKVVLDLRDIRNVHTDAGQGGGDGKNVHLFFSHWFSFLIRRLGFQAVQMLRGG